MRSSVTFAARYGSAVDAHNGIKNGCTIELHRLPTACLTPDAFIGTTSRRRLPLRLLHLHAQMPSLLDRKLSRSAASQTSCRTYGRATNVHITSGNLSKANINAKSAVIRFRVTSSSVGSAGYRRASVAGRTVCKIDMDIAGRAALRILVEAQKSSSVDLCPILSWGQGGFDQQSAIGLKFAMSISDRRNKEGRFHRLERLLSYMQIVPIQLTRVQDLVCLVCDFVMPRDS